MKVRLALAIFEGEFGRNMGWCDVIRMLVWEGKRSRLIARTIRIRLLDCFGFADVLNPGT